MSTYARIHIADERCTAGSRKSIVLVITEHSFNLASDLSAGDGGNEGGRNAEQDDRKTHDGRCTPYGEVNESSAVEIVSK